VAELRKESETNDVKATSNAFRLRAPKRAGIGVKLMRWTQTETCACNGRRPLWVPTRYGTNSSTRSW